MQSGQATPKEEIQKEYEGWARFLYKQYKKKKVGESLSEKEESVE